MSGFSADWLALREPADLASRDPGLLQQAAIAATSSPIIVDLGSGTGAMMRALAPALPLRQSWRLVDDDRQLLAACRAPAGVSFDLHAMSLQAIADLPLGDATLVTATALIDLVSEDWLDRLVARVAAARLPLYVALTYDGLAEWQPAHALDATLADALNAHQRTDKGFGAALGPDATDRLAAQLALRGYRVARAESPWRLGPQQAALQIATNEGFAGAARALGACNDDALADWLSFRRSAALMGGMGIGHQDLLALPI